MSPGPGAILFDGHMLAIVDWKAFLIFAAVALRTTVVVGFSLILTPFG